MFTAFPCESSPTSGTVKGTGVERPGTPLRPPRVCCASPGMSPHSWAAETLPGSSAT